MHRSYGHIQVMNKFVAHLSHICRTFVIFAYYTTVYNRSINKKLPIKGTCLSAVLVLQVGKSLHQITEEIARWRDILAILYKEYHLVCLN